jgi:hypothetical protein
MILARPLCHNKRENCVNNSFNNWHLCVITVIDSVSYWFWKKWEKSKWFSLTCCHSICTSAIDDCGRYDHQSKIQQKQKYWINLAKICMTRLKKTVGRWKPNVKLNRHQQVVLSRLQICHTHLTHSHFLTWERSPMCDATLQRHSHISYTNVLNFNHIVLLNITLTKPEKISIILKL